MDARAPDRGVVAGLARPRPERWDTLGTRGATVWFTGLSGSGKSTLAAAVEERLVAHRPARLPARRRQRPLRAQQRPRLRPRRAATRTSAGWPRWPCCSPTPGVVAAGRPHQPLRRGPAPGPGAARGRPGSRFVEVYVATPVAVCAERDPKGLYARASAGEVSSFTGRRRPLRAAPPRPTWWSATTSPWPRPSTGSWRPWGRATRPNRTMS